MYGHDHDEPDDVSGDDGGDAVIDGFQIFQEMARQTHWQKVGPNPSIHYHHHLQFLYQVGMYQMVIQGVAPGDGIIDECELQFGMELQWL